MNRKYKKKIKKTISNDFLVTYARNIYLDGKEYDLPDWVFDFREEQLYKITQPGKKLYAKLNEIGINFKIKYPFRNMGKWKFADALLPDKKLFIIIMNFKETVTSVCSMYDRRNFFDGENKCVMILPEEIGKLDKILSDKGFI